MNIKSAWDPEKCRQLVESLRLRRGTPEGKLVPTHGWDAARAHVSEDEMREDFLVALAAGDVDDPAGCAAELLVTRDFDFERECI